ncbi:MAG: threonine/serine dehydratase [Vicinamibacterales bacterium]
MQTPLRRSDWLSDLTAADVFLKLETLQPTFSFKIRGALNAVAAIVERQERQPARLVTASAGNHGQALSYAARLAGLPLTVYVPETAPRAKQETIRRLGAELIGCADYDEAESRAKQHAASGTATFISPYSHPDVIAGAGTVGLEILQQDPGVDAIIAPVGGGGLVSGIAIAVKDSGHRAEIIGVEVEASCPFQQGLAAGRIVHIDVGRTLADGLSGNLDPDTITFDIVRTLVDRMTLVTEDQLRDAIAGVFYKERLIAEAAGAAGVAAMGDGALPIRGRRIAVVLSGANIDSDVLASLI